MKRSECYRILDLPDGASAEEIKRAWRELNKIWHPDRFGNDAELRRRAEEKLKQINMAYEFLRREGAGKARSEHRARPDEDGGEWKVRDHRGEVRARDFSRIARWVLDGRVVGSDELWDPRAAAWVRVANVPELARLIRIRTLQRWTRFALFAAIGGFVILIRRPAGITAAIGLSLIGFAFIMMVLYRRSIR